MKHLTMLFMLLAGLLFIIIGTSYADDVSVGYRSVDQSADASKGEMTHKAVLNQDGKITAVSIEYTDGHIRDELYSPPGVLKASFEHDGNKGWSRQSHYDSAGVLIQQQVRTPGFTGIYTYDSGVLVKVQTYSVKQPHIVVFLNAERLPTEIIISPGEVLRLFNSKPQNGAFIALSARASDGGTNDVLKWTIDGGAPPAGFEDIGGFIPSRQGAAEVQVVANHITTKLSVIVQEGLSNSGISGHVSEEQISGTSSPTTAPAKSKPLAGATIIITDKVSGKEVGRTKSDSDGDFKLGLPDGLFGLFVQKYVLVSQYQNGEHYSPVQQEVEVKSHTWTKDVNVRFQSSHP